MIPGPRGCLSTGKSYSHTWALKIEYCPFCIPTKTFARSVARNTATSMLATPYSGRHRTLKGPWNVSPTTKSAPWLNGTKFANCDEVNNWRVQWGLTVDFPRPLRSLHHVVHMAKLIDVVLLCIKRDSCEIGFRSRGVIGNAQG